MDTDGEEGKTAKAIPKGIVSFSPALDRRGAEGRRFYAGEPRENVFNPERRCIKPPRLPTPADDPTAFRVGTCARDVFPGYDCSLPPRPVQPRATWSNPFRIAG